MKKILFSVLLLAGFYQGYSQIPVDSVMAKIAKGKMYTLVLLKSGRKIPQKSETAKQMQIEHLTHLFTMEQQGKISIFGPVMNDVKIKGILVFNSVNKDLIKNELANDPYIKAGILKYEFLDWFSIPGQKIPN
jgi:uncharacterized protein YciI